MADENINKSAEELTVENQNTEAERRIKQLSEKVRLTSEERDEKDKLLKEKDAKITELEAENTFNTGFTETLSTHPSASEHRDEIKEKVKQGYSVEDATYAVLGKAGKLGTPATPPAERENPAGGSADTKLPQTGSKSIEDMTQEERRSALAENLGWS